MKPVSKAGLVVLGYVTAFVLASAVVAARIIMTMGPVAQASSGMYAFGDAIVFVGVFGLVALVPTAAALVWLRPYARFWTALSTAGLLLATTGLTAIVLFAVGRRQVGTPVAMWGAFSVLRILISPLFVLTFLVCALASPRRSFRIALVVALAMETAVSAYGGWTWFVPLIFGGPY